jgi:hypothetical protein
MHFSVFEVQSEHDLCYSRSSRELFVTFLSPATGGKAHALAFSSPYLTSPFSLLSSPAGRRLRGAGASVASNQGRVGPAGRQTRGAGPAGRKRARATAHMAARGGGAQGRWGTRGAGPPVGIGGCCSATRWGGRNGRCYGGCSGTRRSATRWHRFSGRATTSPRRRRSSSPTPMAPRAVASTSGCDTVAPLLGPCYDLATVASFLFSHADGAKSSSLDFRLRDVSAATCGGAKRSVDGPQQLFFLAQTLIGDAPRGLGRVSFETLLRSVNRMPH